MAGNIVARMVGGLGNQLFIYAAARRQAHRLGVELAVDVDHYHAREDFRFELDSFTHSAVLVHTRPGAERRKRGWSIRAARRRGPVFTERSFAYDQGIDGITAGTRIEGYFQSWRYFDDISAMLRHELESATGATPWLDEWRDRLNGSSPICLHVRRGDYTAAHTSSVHGLTSPAYFQRAVTHLRSHGHDGPLVVFSDDPASAREELQGLGDLVSVDVRGTPYETLRLMADGGAVVMSNSSFSWWAAWLGEREGRTVIAPRPWFEDASLDSRDLLLPTWLTLERRSL